MQTSLQDLYDSLKEQMELSVSEEAGMEAYLASVSTSETSDLQNGLEVVTTLLLPSKTSTLKSAKILRSRVHLLASLLEELYLDTKWRIRVDASKSISMEVIYPPR